MNEAEIQEMENKILKGLSLACKRLLKQKRKENGILVITDKDGNIVHVKARDLNLKG